MVGRVDYAARGTKGEEGAMKIEGRGGSVRLGRWLAQDTWLSTTTLRPWMDAHPTRKVPRVIGYHSGADFRSLGRNDRVSTIPVQPDVQAIGVFI
jgi:hypothetical protein